MSKIRINNLKFFTRNGVLAEEKHLGQQIEIDLGTQLSLAEAERTDDATQTVNYTEMSELIAQRVNNHSYNLIEDSTSTILDDIFAGYQEQLDKVIIKIRKYSVPMLGLFGNIEAETGREVQVIDYIALDNNISDPCANLVRTRNHLNEGPQTQVVAPSRLYETDPYGYTDQGNFLNAVLKIDASYTAKESLAVTQGIE